MKEQKSEVQVYYDVVPTDCLPVILPIEDGESSDDCDDDDNNDDDDSGESQRRRTKTRKRNK